MGNNKIEKIMAQSEADFKKRKVSPWLRARQNEGKLWYFMPIGGKFSKKGVPDYIVCISGGHFIGVEVKKDATKDLTEHQKNAKRHIESVGGTFYKVTPENWEDIKKRVLFLIGSGNYEV